MATDAFEQGRQAFAHNLPMSACEYPSGSNLRDDWMSGWTGARNAAPAGADSPSAASHARSAEFGWRGRPGARIGEDEVRAAAAAEKARH